MSWSVSLSGHIEGAVDDVVKEEQAILDGLRSLVDGINSRAKSSIAGGRFFGSFVVQQNLAGGGDPVVVVPTSPVTPPVTSGPAPAAEVPPADAPAASFVDEPPLTEAPAPEAALPDAATPIADPSPEEPAPA